MGDALGRVMMARREPSILGRAIIAGLVLVLSGCVGTREGAPEPDQAAPLPPIAKRMFLVAYEQITDRYVRPVAPEALARAGLGNLKRIDGALAVNVEAGVLTLRHGGTIAGSFAQPRGAEAGRWAQFTVSVMDAARAHSGTLAKAPVEQLYQAVLDGMMGELDAYSRYAGQDTARESRAQRDGFGGIGLTIDTEAGDVRVQSVIPGSPAALAQIKVDDRITHVDGEPVVGLPAREVVTKLRGPVGQTVTVEVRRAGEAAGLRFGMARTHILPQTVTLRGDASHADIKITAFNQRTRDSLVEALRAARRDIAGLDGVILDLRGNLGGLLDQAIGVADVFLAEGAIVSTRGRHRAAAQSSAALRGDVGEELRVVVLVNGSSASASEIVAAALQDNGRAVVVGSTSFGNGSVQTVVPMPNDGELILTWARFHAPSGYAIQDLGISPNVCTSQGPESAADLVARVRATGAMTPQSLARWRAANHDDLPLLRSLRENCQPEHRERPVDYEVARALLADRQLYARALSPRLETAQGR